jgi:hypothetical protein
MLKFVSEFNRVVYLVQLVDEVVYVRWICVKDGKDIIYVSQPHSRDITESVFTVFFEVV